MGKVHRIGTAKPSTPTTRQFCVPEVPRPKVIGYGQEQVFNPGDKVYVDPGFAMPAPGVIVHKINDQQYDVKMPSRATITVHVTRMFSRDWTHPDLDIDSVSLKP